VVNTPTTHGSVGMTTGLDPAMTLGCGGSGGNITSDNIGPRHLLNIKRLAYETQPVNAATTGRALEPTRPAPLPKVAALPAAHEVDVSQMRQQVASFLVGPAKETPAAAPPPAPESQAVVGFVCEDDVKDALKTGRKILIGERTIITPSARDLGEARRVFVQANWPRA
jgi:acetaldehyde dehydrogenase (acetylating)